VKNRVDRGLCALLVAACTIVPSVALAQKSGGILRTYNRSSPSTSIIEEATTAFAFSPVLKISSSSIGPSRSTNRARSGRVARGDYAVVLNLTGSGVDDPDVTMVEGYSCGSERNYTKYCNKDVDALIEKQSQEIDPKRRLELVWAIEKVLIEDAARPIIFHGFAGTCWHAHVKNQVLHENSIYNHWRLDNVWLDKQPRDGSPWCRETRAGGGRITLDPACPA
jgi:ABC-type transport system substrate-binding protein